MDYQTENISSSHSQKSIDNVQNQTIKSRIQLQHQKMSKHKQRVIQLEKQIENLKQNRAEKISNIDDLNRIIRKLKEHQAMIPMIKQLRAHYRKLREHLGPESDDLDVDQMSYEQLLQLGDKIGKVSKGITEQQFLGLQRVCCMITEQCSICQDDLTLGAECIKLKCGHMYDTDCLKQWIKMQKICPLCKTEII